MESVRCATYFGGEVPTLNNVLGVANARKGDSYETTNITSAGTDWEGLERQQFNAGSTSTAHEGLYQLREENVCPGKNQGPETESCTDLYPGYEEKRLG